jgi:hypothetical protein
MELDGAHIGLGGRMCNAKTFLAASSALTRGWSDQVARVEP